MANFDEPIIITNTKVPKRSGGGGNALEFLSPNRLLIIGAVILAISVFIPYIRCSYEFMDEKLTYSYTLWSLDKFDAIIVLSYGFFALFASFFESRWIMIIVFIDCVTSTYKSIKHASEIPQVESFLGIFMKTDITYLIGFYVYLLASLILIVGIVWKFKSEWLSSVF